MRRFSARRAVATCAPLGAALAVLAAPGVASAKPKPVTCNGSNILAEGSSAQKSIQTKVWTIKFNESNDPAACNGSQGAKKSPKVRYEAPGSGAGLEKWGVNHHAFQAGAEPGSAIAATDEPINKEQKEEIESNALVSPLGPETVQSIPVIQFAVSAIVNLPGGCTAESHEAPGRLVLADPTLEGIFRGTINTWKEVQADEASNGSGDVITCASESEKEKQIIRIVRFDQSGTTHVFKKFLFLVNQKKWSNSGGEEFTWDGASEGKPNVEDWPAGKVAVERPGAKGGGEEVNKTAATESSIGYANLADAREKGTFSKPSSEGGPHKHKFWAEIENNATGAKGGKPPKFAAKIKAADPSTNGDAEPLANSNCLDTKYTNGEGTKFPPKTTGDTWNTVTTEVKQKNYPICGLTYDMLLTPYSDYLTGTGNEEAAHTASNYVNFILSTGVEGGQTYAEGVDYEPLPSKILKEAQKGAELKVW
jgi:ABC-type phosphate transport system substrate-binding protein